MYYFRKKSWSSHALINEAYRKRHKKAPNVEGKKGGLFFKGDDKVHIADDGTIAVKGSDDLESPAFGDDQQFDDEMLIPDLAKHLQSHHDEIDKQLLSQAELLEELQTALTKEVDELKNLLTSTALEMASGGNSPEQRNKRLQALLLQLKSDTLARGLYDSESDTATQRLMALILQVKNVVLGGGIKNIASNVVNDVVHQAIELSDQDLPVEGMHSTVLAALIETINDIKEGVKNGLIGAAHDEKRRSNAAEETFSSARCVRQVEAEQRYGP